MKKTKIKKLAALLAISVTVFHSDAQNAETESLSPFEIVGLKSETHAFSSSLKSGLPLKKIPQSVSVMTEEEFEARGANSIGDIINYTPGVMNAQGEGHRDAVVIRGLRTTADFYVDGVRDDVQYYRPLYNVDQVEVLRGSNAMVAGFGGGYGLINRVSKKAIIGEDLLEIQGSIDTFGETNVQLDKNFNTGENNAFRINLFSENLENHRDFYYGDGFGINPTMRYQIGSSILDLSYEYLDQERFIDRGIPTGTDNLPVKSLSGVVYGDPLLNNSTHKAHIIRAVLETEFSGSITGRLKLAHNNHDKMYQNFYANDYIGSTVELKGYKDTTQRKSTTLSGELIGELETGNILHNLLAGFEIIATDNDNDRYKSAFTATDGSFTNQEKVDFASNPFAILGGKGVSSAGKIVQNDYTAVLNDKNNADVTITSAYLQDDIKIGDSLNLLIGGRVNSFEMEVENKKDNTTQKDHDVVFLPRIGLTYELMENTTAFVGYSENANPRSDEQYANLKDANEGRLDPDTFETLELGVRVDLGNHYDFSASYFQIDAEKPELTSAFTSKIVKSQTAGFELVLNGSITDSWFFNSSYANLDAKDDGGDKLAESPENMFSIWNNYMISDKVALGLGVISYGDSLIKTGKDEKLPAYTRVDTSATYALSENTSVQLHVENITDELYFPHAHGAHQVTVGAPINAMLTITSTF